eukprot:627763_1
MVYISNKVIYIPNNVNITCFSDKGDFAVHWIQRGAKQAVEDLVTIAIVKKRRKMRPHHVDTNVYCPRDVRNEFLDECLDDLDTNFVDLNHVHLAYMLLFCDRKMVNHMSSLNKGWRIACKKVNHEVLRIGFGAIFSHKIIDIICLYCYD